MATVPEHVRWAVARFAVRPDDEILEVGCGPGAAVALVCEQLDTGRITAIDRSRTAIDLAAARNADAVAAGNARLHQTDLASLAGSCWRFDTVFAVNVNVFWTQPRGPEGAVVAQLLGDGGAVHLCYETPGGPPRPQITDTVASVLEAQGLSAEVVVEGRLACISGRRR